MNRTIGVAIPLTLILLAFLGFVACTSEPTNSDKRAAESASPTPTGSPTNDPCGASNISTRLGLLKTLLEDPRTDLGDRELNAQRQTKFDIKIEADGSGGILMRVRGKIATDDNPPKLRKLVMFLDKFMKKGCVSRVSFESMSATSASGFEWSMCDQGMCPTPPNGECVSCTHPTGNENAANTNANTNTNSGSNGNVNRTASGNRNAGP